MRSAMKIANSLAVMCTVLAGCGPLGIYDYPAGSNPGFPQPVQSDTDIKAIQIDDPELQDTDSLEMQALKIAASKVHGNARKHYAYQERWRPGAMAQDMAYLQYLVAHPAEAAMFQSGFWRAALDALEARTALHVNPINGMFPGIRIVHATGRHQCWSSKAIGYSCEVDNRMYTDCNQAVQKLRETNCCKFQYFDGVSNGFTSTGCF